MMPASNMKIVTLAAAADTARLGLPLHHDARNVGTRLKRVRSKAISSSAAAATRRSTHATNAPRPYSTSGRRRCSAAGIQQIDGRIIGNDQAFDDEGIGPGWAWDYLQFGYAAPGRRAPVQRGRRDLDRPPGSASGRPCAGDAHGRRGTDARQSRRDRARADPLRPSTTAAGSISPCSKSAAASPPTRPRSNAQSPSSIPRSSSRSRVKDGLIARGIAVSGAAVDFDDVAAEMAGQRAERADDRRRPVAAACATSRPC